jgi:hypothetical protein
MADLSLNLVFGSQPGRFQPIFDGRVKPEDIALKISRVSIDELFWRIPTKDDIDVAELSLTGTIWGMQHGQRWTALPIFPGWVFGCHTEPWCAATPASKSPRTSRASASACRNIR